MATSLQWAVLAAVAAVAVAALLAPLLRPRAVVAGRFSYERGFYLGQLDEVQRDLERGLLGPAQAETARTEIKRRLLAAAQEQEAVRPIGRGPSLVAAALLALALPAGSAGLYATLGSPGMPDHPHQSRLADGPGGEPTDAARILAMVDRLAERLRINPQDAEGWRMLGRSYKALGRYTEAGDAFGKAVQQGAADADAFASLGEMLVTMGRGTVSGEAYQAFLNALHADPADPRARFYLGLNRLQGGDPLTAIAVWRDLEATAAPQASWLAMLRRQIAEAGAKAGIDPSAVTPAAPPEAATVASAGLAAGQRGLILDGVRELTGRLARDPADAESWQRLGRSYRAMGDLAKAAEAYQRGVALRPTDVELRLAYADVLLAAAPDPDRLTPAFVEVMRQILELEPDHDDALFYLGLAEAQGGSAEAARRHWRRLLGGLAPGAPERAEIERRLRALPGPG